MREEHPTYTHRISGAGDLPLPPTETLAFPGAAPWNSVPWPSSPCSHTSLLTFPGVAASSLLEVNYNQFFILHGNGEDTGLD